ncbi:type II toxin-antitoxin system PemK/MazF family toxin [Gracilimonas tropica]|uniref:type II toxin-antitoxin system PemK/MazF family toxin n=1 Tax=Gracilimonas tropica TaxID=454600 RepID=UPI00036BE5C2|nr:type II toxin-antitoxin system PemK/MazF family toxin [Gracilimonas tropica]
MKKGDIVLVPFPFTDLTGAKNRPALVLISDDLDVTLCFISTQLKWKENTDIVLSPSNRNGLKKKSLIRLSKIATVDKELVLGKLGELNQGNTQAVNSNLIELFELK